MDKQALFVVKRYKARRRAKAARKDRTGMVNAKFKAIMRRIEILGRQAETMPEGSWTRSFIQLKMQMNDLTKLLSDNPLAPRGFLIRAIKMLNLGWDAKEDGDYRKMRSVFSNAYKYVREAQSSLQVLTTRSAKASGFAGNARRLQALFSQIVRAESVGRIPTPLVQSADKVAGQLLAGLSRDSTLYPVARRAREMARAVAQAARTPGTQDGAVRGYAQMGLRAVDSLLRASHQGYTSAKAVRYGGLEARNAALGGTFNISGNGKRYLVDIRKWQSSHGHGKVPRPNLTAGWAFNAGGKQYMYGGTLGQALTRLVSENDIPPGRIYLLG